MCNPNPSNITTNPREYLLSNVFLDCAKSLWANKEYMAILERFYKYEAVSEYLF